MASSQRRSPPRNASRSRSPLRCPTRAHASSPDKDAAKADASSWALGDYSSESDFCGSPVATPDCDSESENLEEQFEVDNSVLKSTALGIAYRHSMKEHDKGEAIAHFKTIVAGARVGEDWLSVSGGMFLPITIKGKQVLRPLSGGGAVDRPVATPCRSNGPAPDLSDNSKPSGGTVAILLQRTELKRLEGNWRDKEGALFVLSLSAGVRQAALDVREKRLSGENIERDAIKCEQHLDKSFLVWGEHGRHILGKSCSIRSNLKVLEWRSDGKTFNRWQRQSKPGTDTPRPALAQLPVRSASCRPSTGSAAISGVPDSDIDGTEDIETSEDMDVLSPSDSAEPDDEGCLSPDRRRSPGVPCKAQSSEKLMTEAKPIRTQALHMRQTTRGSAAAMTTPRGSVGKLLLKGEPKCQKHAAPKLVPTPPSGPPPNRILRSVDLDAESNDDSIEQPDEESDPEVSSDHEGGDEEQRRPSQLKPQPPSCPPPPWKLKLASEGELGPGDRAAALAKEWKIELDERALQALEQIPEHEARTLLRKVYLKGAQINNPSVYVYKTAERIYNGEGLPIRGPPGDRRSPKLQIMTYGLKYLDASFCFQPFYHADLQFDVRCFRDPGAGALRSHDGHHPEIMLRMSQHELFQQELLNWRTILEERLAAHVHTDQPLRVAFFCRSGQHRSVASAVILEHVAQETGIRCIPPQHFHLTKCRCFECSWPRRRRQSGESDSVAEEVLEESLRIWLGED